MCTWTGVLPDPSSPFCDVSLVFNLDVYVDGVLPNRPSCAYFRFVRRHDVVLDWGCLIPVSDVTVDVSPELP
jgi:hypothetical protein